MLPEALESLLHPMEAKAAIFHLEGKTGEFPGFRWTCQFLPVEPKRPTRAGRQASSLSGEKDGNVIRAAKGSRQRANSHASLARRESEQPFRRAVCLHGPQACKFDICPYPNTFASRSVSDLLDYVMHRTSNALSPPLLFLLHILPLLLLLSSASVPPASVSCGFREAALKSPTEFHEQRKHLDSDKTEDALKHKVRNRPDCADVVNMHVLQASTTERSIPTAQMKLKRARLADDLNEKIALRPGPLELVEKNILPVDSAVKEAIKGNQVSLSKSADAFAFEEDSSSDGLSPDQTRSEDPQGSAGSPADTKASETPLAGPALGAVQDHSSGSENDKNDSASQLSNQSDAGKQGLGTLGPSTAGHTAVKSKSLSDSKNRHKKPKDPKPKVKKLKYHQYIPPDQKAEKSPPPMDSAYARLLQQQQLFLQLQILSQQEQHRLSYPGIHQAQLKEPNEQMVRNPNSTSAPLSNTPLSPVKNSFSGQTGVSSLKPGPLPSNLDDLKVEDLRQKVQWRLPGAGERSMRNLLEDAVPSCPFAPQPRPGKRPGPAPCASEAPGRPDALPSTFLSPQCSPQHSPLGAVQSPQHISLPPSPNSHYFLPSSSGGTQGEGHRVSSPVGSQACAAQMAGLHSSDKTGPKFSIPSPPFSKPTSAVPEITQPPSYEDAVKQQVTRSQQIDDLLDVLIESGEMPADAREDHSCLQKVPKIAGSSRSPNAALSKPSSSGGQLSFDHYGTDSDEHLEVLLNSQSPLGKVSDVALLKIGHEEPPFDGIMDGFSGKAAEDLFSAHEILPGPLSPIQTQFSPSSADSSGLRLSFTESPWETMEWLDLTPPSSTPSFSSLGPSGPSIFNIDFLDVTDLNLNSPMDLHLQQW
ncbi:myocardin [Puma concolor]|uniref:Phosphatase and actin regulator n=1 Tax=Puma concolor TaxID=9696 RepID=A0A6P6HK29_PUMCO|nr:myocardin [Puma concolor]